MTMEKLYGVSLEEYLRRQGMSKEDLEKKIERDIEMLWENYQKYANRQSQLSDIEEKEALEIYQYLVRKRKKLEAIRGNK